MDYSGPASFGRLHYELRLHVEVAVVEVRIMIVVTVNSEHGEQR